MESIQSKILRLIKEMNNNGLRVGQIMSNVFDVVAKNKDPFYVSDDELADQLEKYSKD